MRILVDTVKGQMGINISTKRLKELDELILKRSNKVIKVCQFGLFNYKRERITTILPSIIIRYREYTEYKEYKD
jgi:hypothetical protein